MNSIYKKLAAYGLSGALALGGAYLVIRLKKWEKFMKIKWIKDWKKQLKSYSFLSMLGNFLIALSVSGLSVLGVLSSELALPLLIGCALFLGLLGLIGRFVDQSIDDDGEGNAD